MRFTIEEMDVIENRANTMKMTVGECLAVKEAAYDLYIASLRLGIALRNEQLKKLKESL